MDIYFDVQKKSTELQWLNHKTDFRNTKLQQVNALSCNLYHYVFVHNTFSYWQVTENKKQLILYHLAYFFLPGTDKGELVKYVNKGTTGTSDCIKWIKTDISFWL